MLNLYWRRGSGKTVNLVEQSFSSEEVFERYIFEHKDLLEDIYLIKRQIRTGKHQGIPDIIGVDQDGRICIIEMKNQPVDEAILPQILQYAIWAERNPDSIKALWLEDAKHPEELAIDWDNLDIRIILIAPSFRASVLRMSGKLNYQTDLLEVKRFALDSEEFVLITKSEPEAEQRPTITRGLEEYNKAFYEKSHGREAVEQFLRRGDEIGRLVKKKGWPLDKRLNKYYIGFKYGNKLCFGVHWGGTNKWNLILKVPEGIARKIKSLHWEFQRYEAGWKQAVIRCKDPKIAKVDELKSLFEVAYKNVAGLT